jgi:hypothetical protein
MKDGEAGQAANASPPAYVIRFVQSLDEAIEAGRFFQVRFWRWLFASSGAGLLIGALIAVGNLPVGLPIVFACGMLILTIRLAIPERLVGRWRARSVLDRPFELSLGDEGIAWNGPTGTGHIPWTAITEVRANARTVLFVRDRLLVAYVPASAFSLAEERAGVIAYSRRQIANAKVERGTAPPA